MRLQWHDVRDCGIEGKGWARTTGYYERLPRHARRMVSESVWHMRRAATGMSVTFRTNATEIHARWVLRSADLGEANFSRTGFSGLDLYARDADQWRWVGWSGKFDTQRPRTRLVGDLPEKSRTFRIHLPLRNPVVSVQIGLPREATFDAVAPRSRKPIVYYGTSIVHGAYASRPGLVHPSILGRMLDQPIVNLGFSGQAKMDLGMARLLAEVDAECYVIDPLPNMDADLVESNALPFLTTLQTSRPKTPIVMVEDASLSHAWAIPKVLDQHTRKWRNYRRAWRTAQSQSGTPIRYVPGRTLLGDDNEATVDGIHPNDLGNMRIAQRLFTALRPR